MAVDSDTLVRLLVTAVVHTRQVSKQVSSVSPVFVGLAILVVVALTIRAR